MSEGWIGVDLDGTLAVFDQWRGAGHVGEPIPVMVERVKGWLAEGREVRIMTARVCALSGPGAAISRAAIVRWCRLHLGQELRVTASKDLHMVELWDDRAVQMIPNTGRTLAEEHEAERAARSGAP